MEKKPSNKVEESSVPQEIIFQILEELPVKSLLRLRCVSKLWCSIIEDPFFIQSHHTRSHTRPGGCISFCNICSVLSSSAPSLDTINLFSYYCGNSQYVNGLFLIDNWIWNPSTQEFFDIPPMTMNLTPFEVQDRHSSLKFDREYFLGFDPSTMIYKVLARCYITTKRIYQVEGIIVYKVWTLGTNSWRDIDDSDSDSDVLYQSNVFVSDTEKCCIAGVIYSISSFYDDGNALVAFEVAHEKFRVMSLPEGSNDCRCNLTRVGEHLALIDVKLTTIWILEDYAKQLWNRQSLIMMYEGKPLLDDPHKMATPLGTIQTGESLLLLLTSRWVDTPKLFYYDLKSKRLRIVNICQDNAPYVESIFRLKGL